MGRKSGVEQRGECLRRASRQQHHLWSIDATQHEGRGGGLIGGEQREQHVTGVVAGERCIGPLQATVIDRWASVPATQRLLARCRQRGTAQVEVAEQLSRGVRVESVEQCRVPTGAERTGVVAEPMGEVGVGGVDQPQLRGQCVVGLPEQLPHDQGARGGQLLGAQCDVVDGGVDGDEGERCRRIERRRREWTPHADQCVTERIEAG